MTQETFNLIDYGVFGISLLLSLLVGIYYIFKSRRLPLQNQKEEFLMGSRKMPIIPVTLSILTTFLSGLTLLGTPAEVYTKGFFLWVYYMMCPLVLLFTSFAILPVFYKLKYISIYEYLETRFHSRLLRQLGATLFLVNSTFYLSVVIYAPAVALSGVTNISTWPFILVIGVVCTLYTSLGGLKAVVWTDTLQAAFMYAGIFSLTIMGIQSSGGLSQVFYTAYNNERFKSLSNVNPSPFQYDSLWIGMFGGSVFWMSLYGPNQMAMQRYCSMSTLEQGRKVMWLTIPAFIIMGSFCCFLGIVMFSFFDKLGCDPLASKKAHTQDQLVLLMVLNTLGQVPGLSGLFLACLFSGTLSTVSSGINSMAAVVWEDMIKLSFGSRLTDTESTLVTKSLTCAFGFLTVCLSFVAGEIGSIVQAATTLLGSLSGPLIAMFFLGIFTKRATGKSTLIGVLLAMLVNGTIAIGGIVHKPYSAYSLNSANMTQCQSNITYIEKMDQFGNKIVFIGFRLSPYLLTLNGFVLTLITGYTLSWILPEKPQTNIIDREMTDELVEIFIHAQSIGDTNATDAINSCPFKKSCTVVETMRGTDKVPNIEKILLRRWKQFIETHRSEKNIIIASLPIIVIADGYDVIFSGWSQSKLINKFSKFNAGLVVPVEANCWPCCQTINNERRMERYNNAGDLDVYANAGLMIGDLLSMIYRVQWSLAFNLTDTKITDQAPLQEFYLAHRSKPGSERLVVIHELNKKLEINVSANMFANHPEFMIKLDSDQSIFDCLDLYNMYTAPLSMDNITMPAKKFKRDKCMSFEKAIWNDSKYSCCNHQQHHCIRRPTECSRLYEWRLDNSTDTCTLAIHGKAAAPFAVHGNGGARYMLQKLVKKAKLEKCW